MPDPLNPQFTVVIPLHNKDPYIAAAIRSVLGQSLPPLEVIVVIDGCGLEDTKALSQIVDPRVRTLTRSIPGPGGYAARNLGIRKARGDWIAFLDADDIWKPDHLAGLAQAIAACPTAECVFSGVEIVANGTHKAYPMSSRHLRPGKLLHIDDVLAAWLATRRCPMWTGGVAAHREALIEAGMFPEGRALRGGDKDLWLRILAIADATYSPAATAEYHIDAINRVSSSAPYDKLPIVTSTIAELLILARGRTRRLLRRVSNQEVRLYAQHAARQRQHTDRDFLKQVYLPEGWYIHALVPLFNLVSLPTRLFGRRKRGF